MRTFLLSLCLVSVLTGGLMTWIFYQDITADLPPLERLADYAPPAATRVYANDGTLIGEFFLEKRYPVSFERIPSLVRAAFMAAEDAHFYTHPGIDPISVVRALFSNWTAGQVVQGGSTITQQVVRYLLLSPEKNYRRKLREMVLALRLERQLSKDEIFSLYLNQIYLGGGAYGIGAAAREYFAKHVEELSLAEAAMLAGLPPAPSRYSPVRHWQQAKARQQYVLERMVEEGFISPSQAQETWEALLTLSSRPASRFTLAPYYVEYVRQFLEKRYGGKAPYQLGLQVLTAVDLALQRKAEEALRAGIKELCRREGCGQGDVPQAEGALMAIDLTSGEVKAMVGGYDFARSQFNRALQAKRQPGSAFKPLLYAAALDRGYTPATVVVDSPISYWVNGHLWVPQNYEEKHFGPTRLREALTYSRNVVAVKVAARLGPKYLLSYLPRLGIRSHLARNLSLALGTSEMTMLELLRAHGVFATQGRLLEPMFITKIMDIQGNVLEEFSPASKQVLSPQTAYLMTSMLKSVVERGTGRRVKALARPVAGKTGTSSEFEDAWFIGYTPEMLAGVWVGFDEKRPLGEKETGGRVAAPIWLDFMQAALANKPVSDFSVPEGVIFVNIDPRTGLRALPNGGRATLECFKQGTEPRAFTMVAEAPAPPPVAATPPDAGSSEDVPVPSLLTRSLPAEASEAGF